MGTHNEGMSYFNSAYIEIVTVVFMLLAAVNYSIFLAGLRRQWSNIWVNSELRAYLLIFGVSALVCAVSLFSVYRPVDALRYGAFQAASILSTNGCNLADYEIWPPFTQTVLLFLALLGGCSGSSGGGIKVVRFTILAKQFQNELRSLIYPNAVFSVQMNKRIGRKDVVYSVSGFFFLSIIVISAVTLITAGFGYDVYTSFSSSIAITSTVGFGFGAVGPKGNYGAFPDVLKYLYSAVMIAGRMELMPVAVLFTRAWREY
jgi:trk system potassium uptake protein TrkH